MAYQTGKTGAKQTAYNVAATLTAAFAQAGIQASLDEALAIFEDIKDQVFADLEKQVEADNELFKANDSGPKSSGGRAPAARKSSGGGRKSNTSDPESFELTWGAFSGCTLGQVAAMSKSEAEEYGYQKSGIAYIEWLAGNENPRVKVVADNAAALLDAIRATSD